MIVQKWGSMFCLEMNTKRIVLSLFVLFIALVFVSCSSNPADKPLSGSSNTSELASNDSQDSTETKSSQTSSLGEIGHLNVSRHIDTGYTYGLRVNAEGVLGATRYYLYYSKTDDPKTAKILIDNTTNSLSTDLNRHSTSGTYYFWYRAGDGTYFTDFSNRVSITFY
jgi:hypothetical protein